MKLHLSINPHADGEAYGMMSKNWQDISCQISTAEEARSVFCRNPYSPHSFTNGIRKQEHWQSAGCIVADSDDGLTIAEAQSRFKDYPHIIITSRSHMKAKNGKPALPRFHLVLPLDQPITHAATYKQLANLPVFDGFDTAVFETARYFYPSPDDCEVYINDTGKNFTVTLNPVTTPPLAPVATQKQISVSNTSFNIADIERVRSHCSAVDAAFTSIEDDQNSGTAGHQKRIVAANLIKNTINDTDYLHRLFSNAGDYSRETTQYHYDSLNQPPVTCETLQQWQICKSPCQLMADIGRKSPVAFAYRKSAVQLKTNDELMTDIKNDSAFEELLQRIKRQQNPIHKQSLIDDVAMARKLPPRKIEKMARELKSATDDRMNEVDYKDWWRIGAKFMEAVVLKDKGTVEFSNRAAEDVRARLGVDAPEWIIKNKHLHDSVVLNRIGGGLRPLGYEYSKDELSVFHELPKIIDKDSGLISNWLDETFGGYSTFIKEWIAMYTYTNHQHLPVLILTGPRGVGKSLFAEMVGAIYKQLWDPYDARSNFTEHNGAKLATIDEADEIENVKLYDIIKQIGGSEMLSVNEKYGRKFKVKNNLNLIIMSNKRIPLYLKSSEKPTSAENNQFFVYEFPKLKGKIDNSLKYKIEQELGSWLRGEIRDIYNKLESRAPVDAARYRYGIAVPITTDEERLFENTMTEVEVMINEFIARLETGYIVSDDLKTLAYENNKNFHEVKRKMVEMGIIRSVNTEKNPKRNLKPIRGLAPKEPVRYFKLTPEMEKEIRERERREDMKATSEPLNPDQVAADL